MQSSFAALTHGSSGLLLGYLCVAIPMLVGLLRKQAPISKLLLVPFLAIPAALIAALIVAIASPLLRPLGISAESVIQAVFGITAFIAVGYTGGLFLARASTSRASYRRGAFVAPEDSSDATQLGGAAGQRTTDTLGSNTS